MRCVLRKSVFEKLAEHSTLVQWLVLILQCRDKTARVEIQQRLWLMVGIDLDVLVLDVLLLKCDPDALYKGTEPTRVQLQSAFCRVGLAWSVS
jgi:hypothetical protein